MDDDILKTVESILGKNVKIVDCEKTSSVREEEILLINGIPVQLEGEDGLAIKSALISGQVPPCNLLNQLLYQAGILSQPVQLESTVSVKSSLVTKEDVIVAKDGKILDERCHETTEHQYFSSLCDEVWEPLTNHNDRTVKHLSKKTNESLNFDDIKMRLPTLSALENIEENKSNDQNKNLLSELEKSILHSSGTSTSQYINEIPFKNTKREQIDSVITSKSVTDKVRIPIDQIQLQNVVNNPVNNLRKSTIASIKSKPKVELSSSSLCDDDSIITKTTSTSDCSNHKTKLNQNTSKLFELFDNSQQTTSGINSQTSSVSSTNFLCNPQGILIPKTSSSSNTTINEDIGIDVVDTEIKSHKQQYFNYDKCGNNSIVSSISNNTNPTNLINNVIDLNNDIIFDRVSNFCNCKRQILRKSYNLNNETNNNEKFFLNKSNNDKKTNINCQSNNTEMSPSASFLYFDDSSQNDLLSSNLSQNCILNNLDNIKLKSNYDDFGNSVSNKIDLICHNQSSNFNDVKTEQTINSIKSSELLNKNSKISIENSKIEQAKHKTTTTIIDENYLVYRDGLLVSGPLESLIKHMVPTSNYYPDHSFIFAFLLSARLFINPYELLERICQLCEEQQNIIVKSQTQNFEFNPLSINSSLSTSSSSSFKDTCPIVIPLNNGVNNISGTNSTEQTDTKKVLRMFAKNFLRLLSEWVNLFSYDFRDERLMQQVRTMQQKCISIDCNLRQDVSIILQNLLEKLTVLEKYENFLQSIESSDSNDFNSTHLNEGFGCPTSNTTPINNSEKEHNILLHFPTLTTTTTSSSTSSFHQHLSGLLPSYTNHSMSSSSIGSMASITGVEIIEICPSSTVLSQQLTFIELERLSYIGPEEFVQVFAKENVNLIEQTKSSVTAASSLISTAATCSAADIKKTRNLEMYVHWFNRLSYLVATEIVKYSKKKQRVRVIEYWIETARECFNIGNFNSLMAIIAGLNMSPISRLKKTWSKVQTAKFSVLEHQMDPSSNFNSYRSTLKAAMWRCAGATNDREKIIVPFFSLLVKDLYFLNEGCSNRLPNGHINFEKFWQVSKQIKEFISWKEVKCPFEQDKKTIMYLQTNPILNENTLEIASFECEPPENHLEKERFKLLKTEAFQCNVSNMGHHISTNN